MKNNYNRPIVVHGCVETMVKKKSTIFRGSDKCYCFRAAVSVPVLAGSTPVPVPCTLVDGVGLQYAAPSDFASSDLAHAAPAALAGAPPVLATLADIAPALVRVALGTLAAAAAAAPPDCFAGFDLVGCYHGNICFRSSALVPVDSTKNTVDRTRSRCT